MEEHREEVAMGTLEPGDGPDEPVRPDVRVGNTDREAAIAALGTHLEAGRLEVDEYGDRSARASAAVYRGELAELFLDLPAPHPELPRAPHEEPPLPAPVAPAHSTTRTGLAVVGGVVLVMMLMSMVALLVGTGGAGGGIFMLPMMLLIIGGLRHGAARRHWGGPGHGPFGPR